MITACPVAACPPLVACPPRSKIAVSGTDTQRDCALAPQTVIVAPAMVRGGEGARVRGVRRLLKRWLGVIKRFGTDRA